MQELERVIGIAAEAKLTWKLGSMAEEASQTAIWDALRNGHRDAVYFVKALVARLAESGVRYEPPEAATESAAAALPGSPQTPQPEAAKTPPKTASPPDDQPSSPPTSSPSSPERPAADDPTRATWTDFRKAVRQYAKVSYEELPDEALAEIFSVAAGEDGTIERTELSQMLAMADAATALAQPEPLPSRRALLELDSAEELDAATEEDGEENEEEEEEVEEPGADALNRLDEAARRLNLRYAFHTGALCYRDYAEAVERLDDLDAALEREDTMDRRLFRREARTAEPEGAAPADRMARRRGAVELFGDGGEGDGDDDWEDGTDALPDVLARRPATVQAAGRGEERKGRNLPAEWRQELFSLTARRHWLSNPRHAVARMKTALEQSGGDCDARGWNGQTVLHGCAASGFLEGCLFMLHKGADRELQNGRGWSALMIAAKRGHSAVCVALLTAAIPPHDKPAAVRRSLDQCTSNGATPLEIALTHGQPATADILAAHGAVVPARLAALAAKAAGEVPSGGLQAELVRGTTRTCVSDRNALTCHHAAV